MYDHRKIELKWQKKWEQENVFYTNLNSNKKKYYVLDMFPYPSGLGLHVGHPEGYTATDIIARMKRLQGFEVLHPMGFDAFGLPAEQFAIKTGNSPKEFTQKNINNFKKQLKSFGFSFDWTKEVNTTDPNYYKNTQWIFSKLYKEGLAELKDIEVNWSPSLNTVLANEEVLLDKNGNSVSERDGLPVIKKFMKQWVLKITKYAKELFKDLDQFSCKLQEKCWPEGVVKLQKNWIYEQDEKGNYTSKLHLKDWLFSRQRYWGEPFPIIHKENGEIYLIDNKNELPIKLPLIDDYSFSQDGKPALINAKKWIKYNENNIKGTRDLNTMPQWAGSCWYFMAYIIKTENNYLWLDDPKAKKLLNKWLPVDLYIGGQEHAVLHLLYARFWTKFLNKIGIIDHSEPFNKLFNQGMILGPDGSKMAKSKGNIVNPDLIIEEYGADALRIYEMFMGALEDDKPWSDKGIKSSKAWLDRVYRFFKDFAKWEEPSNLTKNNYNILINSVETNYNSLKFNLAISDMMVFINHLYKNPEINKEIALGFLQLLSCIAPHITEEISIMLKLIHKTFISNSFWPKKIIDVKKTKDKRVIIIQINGKLKKIVTDPNLKSKPSKKELEDFVKIEAKNFIRERKIKDIYLIQNKLINIVIE